MTTQTHEQSYGSEAVTAGVRVRTWPAFVPARSDPEGRQFVFSYRIRVTNETVHPVTLISRKWAIVDANGERHDVDGEGVVGRQPTILPGQSFEYTSFCPLATAWGTMEGEYTMRRSRAASDDGVLALEDHEAELFGVKVARFFLVAPQSETITA